MPLGVDMFRRLLSAELVPRECIRGLPRPLPRVGVVVAEEVRVPLGVSDAMAQALDETNGRGSGSQASFHAVTDSCDGSRER